MCYKRTCSRFLSHASWAFSWFYITLDDGHHIPTNPVLVHLWIVCVPQYLRQAAYDWYAFLKKYVLCKSPDLLFKNLFLRWEKGFLVTLQVPTNRQSTTAAGFLFSDHEEESLYTIECFWMRVTALKMLHQFSLLLYTTISIIIVYQFCEWNVPHCIVTTFLCASLLYSWILRMWRASTAALQVGWTACRAS